MITTDRIYIILKYILTYTEQMQFFKDSLQNFLKINILTDLCHTIITIKFQVLYVVCACTQVDGEKDRAYCSQSVSYTHLDVYKRQVFAI